jgi:hypothetical protein
MEMNKTLDSFTEINIQNLLHFIEYLRTRQDDPKALISEAGGKVVKLGPDRKFIEKIQHSCIKTLDLFIDDDSIFSLNISGDFKLTIADLIKLYGTFRKKNIPADGMNAYIFNDDRRRGKHKLQVFHYLMDQEGVKEEEILVDTLRLDF